MITVVLTLPDRLFLCLLRISAAKQVNCSSYGPKNKAMGR